MASTAKASVKVFFNLVVLQLLGKQISVEEQKHTKPRSLKNTKTNNQKPGKRHPTNNRGTRWHSAVSKNIMISKSLLPCSGSFVS